MPTSSLPPKQPQPQSETPSKASDKVKGVLVLKEDINPQDFKGSQLTTDCYYVHRAGGKIDLVRGSMVPIFDEYWDQGMTLTRIQLAGGSRNPKISQPEI